MSLPARVKERMPARVKERMPARVKERIPAVPHSDIADMSIELT